MATKLNYQTAALRVCFDEAGPERISGRVVSQRLSAPMPFSDIHQLVVCVDLLFDRQNHPQAFQRCRFFPGFHSARDLPAALSPGQMLPPQAVESAHGSRATLLLYVATRQNSSWQGFADWLDGSPRLRFSSVLGFLRLLESRLLPPLENPMLITERKRRRKP